jgi:hypothetical protein
MRAGESPVVGSNVASSLSIPRKDLSTGSGLPVAAPPEGGATAEKAEAALTIEARIRAVENFMVKGFCLADGTKERMSDEGTFAWQIGRLADWQIQYTRKIGKVRISALYPEPKSHQISTAKVYQIYFNKAKEVLSVRTYHPPATLASYR